MADDNGQDTSGLASGRATHEPSPDGLGHTVSVPDAWWPISIPMDHEGLFCDSADEGAAAGLLTLMTGLSEEHWCAGWLSGLEHSMWRARENGPMHFGMGEITQRQCDLLRLLSEEADGWWYWLGGPGGGPRFCRLSKWVDHAQAIEARQRQDAETGLARKGESAVHAPTPPSDPSTHKETP